MTDDGGVCGIQILAGQQVIEYAAGAIGPHADFAPFGGLAVNGGAEMRGDARPVP
jgi:hypothetical protein